LAKVLAARRLVLSVHPHTILVRAGQSLSVHIPGAVFWDDLEQAKTDGALRERLVQISRTALRRIQTPILGARLADRARHGSGIVTGGCILFNMVNAICRPDQIVLDFGKSRLDTESARSTAGEGDRWAGKSPLLYYEGDRLPPLEEIIESNDHSKMQVK
jgi:hypothetical protein